VRARPGTQGPAAAWSGGSVGALVWSVAPRHTVRGFCEGTAGNAEADCRGRFGLAPWPSLRRPGTARVLYPAHLLARPARAFTLDE